MSPRVLASLQSSPLVAQVFLIGAGRLLSSAPPKCAFLQEEGGLAAGRTWNALLPRVRTRFLLLLDNGELNLGPFALERLLEAATTTGAGMVYADRWEPGSCERVLHPVNDYQLGSVRDTFEFGPLQLFDMHAVQTALRQHGQLTDSLVAGGYELRLKLSLVASLFHLPEALCTLPCEEATPNLFAYQEPQRQAAEREMETVLTAHLCRLGALVRPPFQAAPAPRTHFTVAASVIIPVRNRVGTVGAAVQSALSQRTDFPFNVIVVDNHSTDGTTALLAKLARDKRVVHLRPVRDDLGIGGCWNEAVASPQCGRWAVQLDSDDLYSEADSLQRLVELMRHERLAMAVGAYTVVNAELKEIPPGLVAHREWTEDNGPNNALRVNGLGAPRAFDTALMRRFPFPNVSYGEDYAVALRLCRQYRVGRIYESLYLCRRWEGNSDATLPLGERNRNDAFKDTLRTLEIIARQRRNRGEPTQGEPQVRGRTASEVAGRAACTPGASDKQEVPSWNVPRPGRNVPPQGQR